MLSRPSVRVQHSFFFWKSRKIQMAMRNTLKSMSELKVENKRNGSEISETILQKSTMGSRGARSRSKETKMNKNNRRVGTLWQKEEKKGKKRVYCSNIRLMREGWREWVSLLMITAAKRSIRANTVIFLAEKSWVVLLSERSYIGLVKFEFS